MEEGSFGYGGKDSSTRVGEREDTRIGDRSRTGTGKEDHRTGTVRIELAAVQEGKQAVPLESPVPAAVLPRKAGTGRLAYVRTVAEAAGKVERSLGSESRAVDSRQVEEVEQSGERTQSGQSDADGDACCPTLPLLASP